MTRRLVCMLALAVSGCATIMHGTKQEIRFESLPPEATAHVGELSVVTPGVLQLSRSKSYEVVLEKPHYLPAHAHVANVAGGTIWGNFVFGGVVGIFVDLADGAAYDLEPTTVQATLVPEPAPPSPPANGPD